MRKLVTIRKIRDIQPIPNADNIELAFVDGWQVVVKKGEFNVGDYGIYFEIDSLLPIDKRYKFLRGRCSIKKLEDGTTGFRIRTIKLKDVISQGLLLPMSMFPEISIDHGIGIDLSNRLNVRKYERPITVSYRGEIKGDFPCFIRKTDQERIQNLPDYFTNYKNVVFEETEKLDGTSATYYFNEGYFGVCSRNVELREDDSNLYWNIAKKLNIENILNKLYNESYENIAIQGEIVGTGINKNFLGIEGRRFYVFDIYDINAHKYMNPPQRWNIVSKLKLKHVPVINYSIKIFNVVNAMNDMIERAEGMSMINNNVKREGIVFKSYHDRISFKVVNNDYLIIHKT